MKYYNNNLALKEQGRKKTVFTKVIRLKSKIDFLIFMKNLEFNKETNNR